MIRIEIESPSAGQALDEMAKFLGIEFTDDMLADQPAPEAPKALDGEVSVPVKTRRMSKKATTTEQPVTDINVNGDLVVETAPAETPVPEPEAPKVTLEEVKAALVDLASKVNPEAVYALIAEYKVTNATGLFTAGKGPDAIAAAKKLIAEAAVS